MARSGRTVLFVSHNMTAIEGLCHNAILLQEGDLVARGPAQEVVDRYLRDASVSQDTTCSLVEHEWRRPGSEVILRQVSLLADGAPSNVVRMGGSLRITATLGSERDLRQLCLIMAIEDRGGRRVTAFCPTFQQPHLVNGSTRQGRITCVIPRLRLLPGQYYVTLFVKPHEYLASKNLDRVDRAVQFTVEPADVFETGFAPHSSHGVFFDDALWEFEPIP
ncbi:MAG: Wzt carbohydrate-binding domain-containing protein [Planctomycetota bacterium]